MRCPFCQSPNAPGARACRACGGPLNAQSKAAVAPAKIPLVAPVPVVPIDTVSKTAAPALLARQFFDKDADPLVGIGFVPDESYLIWQVRENGDVRIWNTQTDELLAFSTGQLLRKSSRVTCAILADGCLVTGHENGRVRWHTLGGSELKSSASHVGQVRAVAATTQLYSGGSDGVVTVTPLVGKRQSRTLVDGLGAMTTLAVSQGAAVLAVGRDDGAVQMWRTKADDADDETTMQLDWTRTHGTAPIENLSFSANGAMLISRDKAGKLGLWAAQTSYQLPLPQAACNSSLAPTFAFDNRLLALADAHDKIDVIDVALGQSLCQLPSLSGSVTYLAFASDGVLLVAGAREVALWQIFQNRPLA